MVGGAPRGPYQKPQKPLSKNNQNHQTHHQIWWKSKEIAGLPWGALQLTTKTIKQKQPQLYQQQHQIWWKSTEHGKRAPGRPYQQSPKPQKPPTQSKNNQNHQNHQKPLNLMGVKGNGRGCPRGALPQTSKTSKNKHNHQTHNQIWWTSKNKR